MEISITRLSNYVDVSKLTGFFGHCVIVQRILVMVTGLRVSVAGRYLGLNVMKQGEINMTELEQKLAEIDQAIEAKEARLSEVSEKKHDIRMNENFHRNPSLSVATVAFDDSLDVSTVEDVLNGPERDQRYTLYADLEIAFMVMIASLKKRRDALKSQIG